MKKKTSLPVKWLLGVMLILGGIALWNYEASNEIFTPYAAQSGGRPHNFFEFLANALGWHVHGSLFGGDDGENSGGNGSGGAPGSRQTGFAAGGRSVNLNGGLGLDGSGAQGANGNLSSSANQEAGDLGQNEGLNAEGGLAMNAQGMAGSGEELYAEGNAEANAESNAQNNAEYMALAENNPQSNAQNNAEYAAGSQEGGLGTGSGGDQGSGSSSGDNTDNTGGTAVTSPAFIDPSGLSTINPIPSDGQVSQSIAQFNQQNLTLAALLAARQAMVQPVQEQAQASKFQTVNTASLQPPSTNQAPSEAVAKIKAHQAYLSSH